jgi:peptide/nickel transport system substrate-binding protein
MNIFQKIVIYGYSILLSLLPTPKYVEGVVGQPQNFLPSKAQSQNDRTISSLIYRGLFKYDIYGATVPDLAETWTVSPDGLIYTIKIKDNQRWTDGRKISSDDLIYTSFKVADLSGVATDKVDDLTVRYTLPNKYAPFLSLLTVGVMPTNSEEKMNPLRPISSGDFRVARIEKNGKLIKQMILVSTNKDYAIKKIVFKYYTNEEELVTAGKLGEVDAFITSGDVKLENFNDLRFPLQGIYYALFFNLRNDKFADLALRQKMEKVLPIEEIIIDKGIKVQGPISRSTFTDNLLVFDKYDKTLSDELLDVEVTLTIPDLPSHKDLATRIKSYWEDKLGMSVSINKVDAGKLVAQVIEPRNFEVLLYGQEVGRDPDRYVLWHSTQKDAPGLNISGFDQVRADRALEEGRKEPDGDKRVVHYNEFQKVVTEQTPAIFLYHPYVHYYISKYISGVGEKYTFTYQDRFLDFANWKRVKTN